MAPSKRKRSMQNGAGGIEKPARVKCPACQKEVPSFFVNSHLDLDCSVLKSSPLTMAPSSGDVSSTSHSGCPPSSSNLVPPGTLRSEDRICKSTSKANLASASSISTSKIVSEEMQRCQKHDIAGDVADLEKNAFRSEDGRDGDGDVDAVSCGRNMQSSREMEEQLCRDYREGTRFSAKHHSGKSLSDSTTNGTLYPSRQPHHQKGHVGLEPASEIDLLTRPFTASNCFPSSQPLKVGSPKGLQVLENFITTEEEQHLLHCLDTDVRNPWKLSRVNGIHRGKSYGNHIFGNAQRRVVSQVSDPMPSFVLPYVERMRDRVPVLKKFFPNEMNAIDYRKGDAHYLKAHMDDRQLSGTVLVNLSLAGSCFMTYVRERNPKESFRVKLLPRSLQVLTGESRYNYTHGIEKNDISSPRRASMTFRQSVESVQVGGPARNH